MARTLQAVRGMNDVLPDESARWERLEEAVRDVFRQYGYRNMRTPVLEPTPLFVRSIGEVTDIVEKEMYTFTDSLSGESLTLRPEATAGVVRAAIEHNLLYPGPQRVWTGGPMFRHERPQKGRYRQFHQFDVEALGLPGPDVDAEQIVMLARLWKRLGIGEVALEINSIGDPDERQAYRARLVTYFEAHAGALDADSRRRLHVNPLRILDSKNPSMQALIEGAPRLMETLSGPSREHFEGLCGLLDEAGVAYRVNTRLVRGMDYYNRTVFEWLSLREGTPLAITAGGRYDGLFAALGGKPAPAIGFGLGVERVLMLLPQPDPAEGAPDAYVVHAGEGTGALARRAAELLRDRGMNVVTHCGGGSFKSQMRRADSSGARYALIVGEDEVAAGEVSVKPLRGEGEQVRAALARLPALLGG